MKRTFKNKTWLPLGMVKDSFEEKWERSLLFYCRLRHIHKKPIFYSFSLRKISKQMNCTVACTKKHLDILKEKGLVSINGNNLCLSGSSKLQNLQSKLKILVAVEYLEDKKDHLTSLMSVVIKRNLHLQKREIKKLINIILMQENLLDSKLSKKDIKKIVNLHHEIISGAHKNVPVERLIQLQTSLSNEKIGKLLNRNQLSGLKIQQDLNRLGYIKSIKRIQLTGEKQTKKSFAIMKKFNEDAKDLHLGKNGQIFTQLPNLILLPEDILDNNIKKTIKDIYDKNDFHYLLNFYEKKNLIIEQERKNFLDERNSRLRISLRNKIRTEELTSKNNLSRTQKALLTIYKKYKGNTHDIFISLEKKYSSIKQTYLNKNLKGVKHPFEIRMVKEHTDKVIEIIKNKDNNFLSYLNHQFKNENYDIKNNFIDISSIYRYKTKIKN